jgi:hypothetical protein
MFTKKALALFFATVAITSTAQEWEMEPKPNRFIRQ